MTLDNASLFELMAAGTHGSAATLAAASVFANWAVWSLPLAGALIWARGDERLRIDLMCMAAALAAAYGLVLAIRLSVCLVLFGGIDLAGIASCWRHPGFPNGQMVAWWGVALVLLSLGRIAWLGFPLLTVGLGVGWSLVYLGRAFPLDVLGAFPAAAAGALVAWALRPLLRPAFQRVLRRLGLA